MVKLWWKIIEEEIVQDMSEGRCVGSPGMEHLLEEQLEANKRIPKNVKFNRAFEIAKVTAEYMKDVGT